MQSHKPSMHTLKTKEALAILIRNGGKQSTHKSKIAHLFFIADRLAIRHYGTVLFDHDYRVSHTTGVIPHTIVSLINSNEGTITHSFAITDQHVYLDDPDVGNEHLSEAECALLLAACRKFKHMSATQLRDHIAMYAQCTANTPMSLDPLTLFSSPDTQDFAPCDETQLSYLKQHFLNNYSR